MLSLAIILAVGLVLTNALSTVGFVWLLSRSSGDAGGDDDAPHSLEACIGQEGSGEIEDDVEDFACLPECRSVGFHPRKPTKSNARGRLGFRA